MKFPKRKWHRCGPTFLIALAALPAEATTVYYCSSACGANDESAFQTALAALVASGLSSSGWVNFAGETSGLTVTNVGPTHVDFSGFSGVTSLDIVGSQLRQIGSGAGTGTLVTLSGGAVFAFGAHITGSGSGKIVFFEGSPGSANVTLTVASGTTSFVGVISDSPLPDPQFRLGSGNGTLYINDFEIAETPETATYIISGIGLIAVSLLKRRVLRASPAAGQSR